MKQAAGWEMSPEVAYWLAGVKAEWLETLLRSLGERYGSVEGYFRSELGLGPEDLAALREKYLEAAGA